MVTDDYYRSDSYPQTSLHRASRLGDLEMVQLLIAKKADFLIKNKVNQDEKSAREVKILISS